MARQQTYQRSPNQRNTDQDYNYYQPLHIQKKNRRISQEQEPNESAMQSYQPNTDPASLARHQALRSEVNTIRRQLERLLKLIGEIHPDEDGTMDWQWSPATVVYVSYPVSIASVQMGEQDASSEDGSQHELGAKHGTSPSPTETASTVPDISPQVNSPLINADLAVTELYDDSHADQACMQTTISGYLAAGQYDEKPPINDEHCQAWTVE